MVKEPSVSLEHLLARVKAHPDIMKAGMILCHNGIVRDFSRMDGRGVVELQVSVDRPRIESVKSWALSQPGIVALEIEAFEGSFTVGEDLLLVVLAGDIRENVFSVMKELIERIKTECVKKTEIFVSSNS
ncbi:MAG: molybdenum cofactor biosynthesis protein MoaE [Pseudomonadota bacterium]